MVEQFTVEEYLNDLSHPLKNEIEEARKIILKSDKNITEHIKWNAPSFCINGEDRITFRLQPSTKTQLIFHRGAKVKDSTNFDFEDSSGLITWVSKDRGVVELRSIRANQKVFSKLVSDWIEATS